MAVEERMAELRLERRDMLGRRGLRDAERTRRVA